MPTAPPAPVMVLTTVSVSLSATTIQVGQAATANATGVDQNGGSISTGTVTWSSSSPTIATVSGSGTITPLAAGQTTITAAAGSKSGQATLTVTSVPVASVTVSPATASVIMGATQQLTATTLDASNAALTGRTVTWSSSDASKASVSASGLVTAVAVGSATITATCEGRSSVATITVLPNPVASVTVSPNTASVQVGQTQQLTPTTRDAGGATLTGRTVTWTTSDGSTATVTANGLVTAVAVGSATITATSEGKNGAASIIVLPPSTVRADFARLCLNPAEPVIRGVVGICASVVLQTLNPTSGGTDVTVWVQSEQGSLGWNDSATSSAVNDVLIGALNWGSVVGAPSVTTDGHVALIGARPLATVFTVEKNGTFLQISNRVNGFLVGGAVGCLVDPVTSQYQSPYLLVQHCVPQNLTGAIRFDFRTSGTWRADQITALQIGMQWISSNAGGGGGCNAPQFSGGAGTCVLGPSVVNAAPVASVMVTPANATVQVGQAQQLTPTTLDAGGATLTGRTVTWTTSDATTATVSTNGLVTAVAVGSATITATSEGKTGASAITVTAAPSVPVATVTVSPTTASVQVGQTQQLTPTTLDAGGATLTGRTVTWTTSDATKATVTANGLVTAVAVGSATITATSEGKTGTSAITVTALSVTTGSLTITISGLPAGVPANVTVTGPNSFSRQVTATGTLSNLTVGTYTVSASGVVANGTYVPSPPSQQVTVSANATAAASVTYIALPGGL